MENPYVVTLICEICKSETQHDSVESELEIESRWYVDLNLELCEKCKLTKAGEGLITLNLSRLQRHFERNREELTLTHQPS